MADELIDSTLLLVRKELGKQVTLAREIPPGLAILADRQRLQQVFINLLKNAVDAGGPEVTITIRGHSLEDGVQALPQGRYRLGELPPPHDPAHPERPRYALLTLADNGPGIVPDVLEQIFDPFFTTRDVGQGMGLGLYIVQEIVQELNGCIAVDSEPGRGTRFEIALPCGRG
jgi:two-component system, NtrC family, sensor kinase